MEKFEQEIVKLIGTSDFNITGQTVDIGNELTISWEDKSFTTFFTYDECSILSNDFIHDMFIQRLYDYLVPIIRNDNSLKQIQSKEEYNDDIDKQIKRLMDRKL